jgi:hypothetical protein
MPQSGVHAQARRRPISSIDNRSQATSPAPAPFAVKNMRRNDQSAAARRPVCLDRAIAIDHGENTQRGQHSIKINVMRTKIFTFVRK